MSVQKEELYRLIDTLQEKEMQIAKRFLEFLITEPDDAYWERILKSPPFDDEPLSEDDLAAILEAEKDITGGRVKPWEQVKRDLNLRGLSLPDRRKKTWKGWIRG